MRHFTCRSTCTTDSHRHGESCVGALLRFGPTPLVLAAIKSLGLQLVSVSASSGTSLPNNLGAMMPVELATAFRIPNPESLLLSPSRGSQTM